MPSNAMMLAFELHDTWSDKMRLLLILILSSGLTIVHAQENTDTTVEEKKEIIESSDQTEAKKTRKEEVTPDTFNPTEKLSEDIPVDFPVDI